MEPWKLKPAADLGLPLGERLRSLRRESGLVETMLHHLWWGLVRAYFATYHRLEVRGREHLPKIAPFVIAANHSSHLDALALAAPLPWRLRDRIFPIAAGDTFFETPVVAAFAAFVLNALPMWRRNCGSHALGDLRERLLSEPCAFILFPEGTRSRDGNVAAFKPGIGRLVAGTSVPVIPCCVHGTFLSLPAHRHWPRPAKITVNFGPALAFAAFQNDRAGWQEIALALQRAVLALKQPLRWHERILSQPPIG